LEILHHYYDDKSRVGISIQALDLANANHLGRHNTIYT